MGPGEAIRVCLRRYAVFAGRAPRSEYWWFFLFGLVVSGLAMLLGWAAHGDQGSDAAYLAASLLLLCPSLAVTIRRLHDRDRSGWWVLLFLPLLPFDLLTPGHGAAWAAIYVPAIMAMLAGLAMMIPPGTPGANRFGPDPLGPSAENL